MSSIPPNLIRAPNLLFSRISLSNINRTNVDLLRVQQELATGRAIHQPSDDIVKAATIGVLDDRLERSAQLRRNMEHANASLGVLDNTLTESAGIAQEARSIASEQSNLTSSASERESQATIVDQMLRSMFNIANRQGVAGYVLGGTITSRPPVEEFLGVYRYRGEGMGLTTDLEQTSSLPITMGQTRVIGRTSRVKGSVDLDPALTSDTRLADLVGARALPITLGEVEFSFGGGPRAKMDLTGSDTVQDVVNRITNAVRRYEADNSVTILGPGGVSFTADALSIDVIGGSPINPQLQFLDIGNGITAQDLGLTGTPPFAFSTTQAVGQAVQTKLTWRTPVAALTSVASPLGQIRINNAGRSATVDLSAARTLEDVKNIIESTNLGVQVTINEAGDGIDVVNVLSAGSRDALAISEVSGGDTATRLGIRSLSGSTSIADFNHGRGVQVVDGIKDPTSGLISSSLNTDMVITLGDAAATRITIDLTPSDMTTVQNVINVMNAQIQTQLAGAGLGSGDLVVGLAADGNGIALTQSGTFTNPIRVEPQNNSAAPGQLGLINGTYNAATGTLVGEDRARVRVESIFSYLIDLRDSLRRNDVPGIGLAGDNLGEATLDLAETRGLVGSLQQRVDAALARETDRSTLDETTRSSLRDADFASAASRFQALQTQLQAGLQTTAVSQQLSLLDFLR